MSKESEEGSSRKQHKRDIERNRRIQINQLCSTLVSLIPSQYSTSSKDMASQAGKIEHATNYIMQLKERIEGLKKKKEQLGMVISEQDLEKNNNGDQEIITINDDDDGMTILPIIQFCDFGNYLEVVIVTSIESNFKMSQAIRILQEEGAQVVNANYSTLDDKIFHTFHVQATNSRVGVGTSRVQQRLQQLIS